MRIGDLKALRPSIAAQIDRIEAAAGRWKAYAARIGEVQREIEKGLIEKADSTWRLAKFRAREMKIAAAQRPAAARPPGFGLERKLGATDDFLSIEFFEAGLAAARAVGRLVTPTSTGTGFLVGRDVLLTNNHVLPSADLAEGTVLEMDAEENRFGAPKAIRGFALDPERFFATHAALDFTFVAVEPEADDGTPLAGFGAHPMIAGEGKIRVGDSVNVVQHPAGGPKSVVVHNSRLIFLANDIETDEFCYYTSDTDEGSSGSPVFNDRWEVIALHHASVPKTNVSGELIDRSGRVLSVARARAHPEEVVWIANEGVRTSRLVKGFAAMDLPAGMDPVRAAVLENWKTPQPGPPPANEARPRTGHRLRRQIEVGDGAVTIPLNIVVEIGEAALRNRRK